MKLTIVPRSAVKEVSAIVLYLVKLLGLTPAHFSSQDATVTLIGNLQAK